MVIMLFCMIVQIKTVTVVHTYYGKFILQQWVKNVERKASTSLGIRHSYDAGFKLAVIRYARSMYNREAGRKFSSDEFNVRRWIVSEEKLKNATTTRKSFRGPKAGKYPELECRVLSFVQDKREEGMPISRLVIQVKLLEIAKTLYIPLTVMDKLVSFLLHA